jgi:queuine tRNA-ribosyltransferase
MFTIKAESGKARYGILKTKTGSYETPFFMPVATKASVKYINSKDLEDIGIKTIISNALILFLRPGLDIIKKYKGLHNFMNHKGCIFTDSGGFQMLNQNFLIKSDNQGVHFKSPFDGQKHFITPETDMKIQEAIGADVIMALDNVPHHGTSKEHIANCVETTTLWAKRCKDSHKGNQLLFGITQGGIYPDLRKKSTEEIVKIGFDGIALGGLCIGEHRTDMYKMVDISKKIIPKEKPIYIMGVGTPQDIVECVSKGIDIFDSRLPARNARHGTIFTRKGAINLLRRDYIADTTSIEKDCKCFTCSNYSKAYVAYLLKQNEGSGLRLATIHNLYFVNELITQIRNEIKKGTFEKFKKNFFNKYKFNEERGKFSYN